MRLRDNAIEAVDLFCGAGGFSTGFLKACVRHGLNVRLLAINHWDTAIETHSYNHPGVRHLCESLDNVDPRKVVPGGFLNLLMASPECTHHSRARGGKPMSDQSRSSAFHILRWCEALNIENVIIENVQEFRDWGPLHTECYCGAVNHDGMDHDKGCPYGRPIAKFKGRLYKQFLSSLRAMGYTVSEQVINSANYGGATTRQRLFIRARKGGKKIVWPEPTHVKAVVDDTLSMIADDRPTWRPARDIIDWSIPGTSIYTRKKQLVQNTLNRISAGLKRYSGLDVDLELDADGKIRPFVVILKGQSTARSIDEPLPTVTGTQHLYLAEPYLVQLNQNCDARSLGDPVPTVVTGNHLFLTQPMLEPFVLGQQSCSAPRSTDDPIPTISTAGAISLTQAVLHPFVLPCNHGGEANRGHGVDTPMPTITAFDSLALAQPFVVKFYGTGTAASLDDPLDTVTTKDRFALIDPSLIEEGDQLAILDIRFRMLEPKELAAAMGFPDDYFFSGKREAKVKQIGNAISVEVGEALCFETLREYVALRRAA